MKTLSKQEKLIRSFKGHLSRISLRSYWFSVVCHYGLASNIKFNITECNVLKCAFKKVLCNEYKADLRFSRQRSQLNVLLYTHLGFLLFNMLVLAKRCFKA